MECSRGCTAGYLHCIWLHVEPHGRQGLNQGPCVKQNWTVTCCLMGSGVVEPRCFCIVAGLLPFCKVPCCMAPQALLCWTCMQTWRQLQQDVQCVCSFAFSACVMLGALLLSDADNCKLVVTAPAVPSNT